jgi:hypothetical protein
MDAWCAPLSSLQVSGMQLVLVDESPVWVSVTVTADVVAPELFTLTFVGETLSDPVTTDRPFPPQFPSGFVVPPVVVELWLAKLRCMVTLWLLPPACQVTWMPA